MGTVASKESADKRVTIPLRLVSTAVLAALSIFITVPLFLGNFLLIVADLVTYLFRFCYAAKYPNAEFATEASPETKSFFYFSTYYCQLVFTVVAWFEFKGAIFSGFDELTVIPSRDVLYPLYSAEINEKRKASLISIPNMRCYFIAWFPKLIWGAILFTAFQYFINTFYIMNQTDCVDDVCVCINSSDCSFFTPIIAYDCSIPDDDKNFCKNAYFRGDTDKKNLDFGGVSFLILFIINAILIIPFLNVLYEINGLVWGCYSGDKKVSKNEAENPMTRL